MGNVGIPFFLYNKKTIMVANLALNPAHPLESYTRSNQGTLTVFLQRAPLALLVYCRRRRRILIGTPFPSSETCGQRVSVTEPKKTTLK